MARVDNLCAIEKIPGCESTRLNVNDSMVVGDLCGRGRYDDAVSTFVQFRSPEVMGQYFLF